jgi:nicotinamidase-related amidase
MHLEEAMSPEDLRLVPTTTALVIIDVQEKLSPAMIDGGAPCVANVERLLEGARLLGLRTLVTQQYPKGLGQTLASLRDKIAAMPGVAQADKLEFSATANDEALEMILEWRIQGVQSVLVCGMEAHGCVDQTVRGLRELGFAVHVARDACASRTAANLEIGAQLWQKCGAVVTSTEAALFDLVGAAGTDTFKAISKLIR